MTPSWIAAAAVTVALVIPFAASAEALIRYRKSVSLQVGQPMVVHSYRGECGQEPVLSSIQLPKLKTGQLSLGKMGARDSKRCGGRTPAVEVIFTATQSGREKFEVQGDDISVRVKD